MEMVKGTKFYCFLYIVTINAMKQVRDHNTYKHHRNILKTKDLETEHDVMLYIQSLNTNQTSDSFITILCYSTETLDIIDHLRKEGYNIPPSLKICCKVKKIVDFNQMKQSFDFEDTLVNIVVLIEFMLVIVEEIMVKVIIHVTIPLQDANILCSKAMKL